MLSAVSVTLGRYEQQIRSAAVKTGQPSNDPESETAGRQIGAFGEKLMSYAEDGPFKDLSSDFLNDMKKNLEVGNMLQQAADSMEDNQRSDKINKIKTRIAELKERLKFATPQQAKALLRELKQISKEFKLAAQSLSNGGGSTSQLTGANAMTTSSQISAASQTETTSVQSTEAVLQATPDAQEDGSLEAAIETLLGHDLEAADLETLEAGFAQLEQMARKASNGASRDGEKDGSDDNADGKPSDESGDPNGNTQDVLAATIAVREVIAAYTSASKAVSKQESTDGTGYDSTSVRRAQAEELRKISKEIKAVAEEIKRLMDKDDRDQKEDMKKAMSDLDKGDDALDKFQLQSGSNVPGAASTTSTTSVQVEQTAAVYSSLSIEVSVPTSVVT